MPMREVIARSIYRQRPFRTASTRSPTEPWLREDRLFAWEEAPDFYQGECYELADGILADLAVAQAAERAR